MIHPALDAAMIFTSIMLTLAGVAAEGKPEPGGIIGNTYLFCICMGGCGIGAALYLAINAISFKIEETTLVRVIKFICSFLIGGVFTPWFIHERQLDESAENVLMLSAVFGLIGWPVLLTLLPWALSFIPNLVRTKAGDPPKPAGP